LDPDIRHKKLISFKLFFRNDEIVTFCPHEIITEAKNIVGSVDSEPKCGGSKKYKAQ